MLGGRLMAKLRIQGGDFTRGEGWFYPVGGFVLRGEHNRPQSIPLSQLEAVDHASEISLTTFGADETLRTDYERARTEGAAGEQIFIAIFNDGRLLLASTDQKSFEEICASNRGR
jgi:hypothetical protein